jgi:spore coat polysaccharide biosynthesis predicted glycosyltransferase SpsG
VRSHGRRSKGAVLVGRVTRTPRVLMVCDAGSTIGIGHVMRCLALGEEFQSRGFEVLFATETDGIAWAVEQLARRDMRVVAPAAYDDVAGLCGQVADLRPDVLVVDSYVRPRSAYSAVRGSGPVLLAIVDGDPGGRVADVYLDQNIGAETDDWPLPPGSIRLAGLRHSLMRDDILEHRPERPRGDQSDPPRVLAFFGGTDAHGAAPLAARALASTGESFDATVVAATPDLADRVRAVPRAPGQHMDVIGPSDTLAELVTGSDLVVSAAGTSSWELCCLGAAAALVAVAGNQVESYGRAVEVGVVAGLGLLTDLEQDPGPAAAALGDLLLDTERRARLRGAAWRLVDGQGRRRVVDEVVARVPAPTI